jgi:hypothetical protein
MNKQAQQQITIITIVLIIVAGVVGYFIGHGFTASSFSILPSGQYRANPTCTFLTNNAEGGLYKTSGVWITLDDGTGKKGFGYNGYSSFMCSQSGATILPVTTPEGYRMCTRLGYSGRIYLEEGNYGVIFESSQGSSATLTCTSNPTCTESWTCGSWAACTSGISLRSCTDSNNCGTTISRPATSQSCTTTTCGTVGAIQCLSSTTYQTCQSTGSWSGILQCSGTCSNNQCITSGNCLINDLNGNGKVDRDELGQTISRWISGQ